MLEPHSQWRRIIAHSAFDRGARLVEDRLGDRALADVVQARRELELDERVLREREAAADRERQLGDLACMPSSQWSRTRYANTGAKRMSRGSRSTAPAYAAPSVALVASLMPRIPFERPPPDLPTQGSAQSSSLVAGAAEFMQTQ